MTEPRQPNMFELLGDEGVTFSYSQTSQTGAPQLSYRDERRDVSRTGDEINTEEVRIGTLVTIELEAVPDQHVIELSLLVPSINLMDGAVEFKTFAVETTNRTSIAGPGLISGALQTYTIRPLRGTARFVES